MDLEATRIFVKIAEAGSFSRAATILRVPKSTLSRTLQRLEAEVGKTLLIRTTRSQTLTAEGKAFYESCREAIEVLERAQKNLFESEEKLTGRIRLTSPEDIGILISTHALNPLMKQHPELTFDLHFSDEIIDLVKEGFDLAIRLGKLTPSRFKAQRVGQIAMILVATPEYLKNHKAIKRPQDLLEHDCICYSSANLKTWNLSSKTQKSHLKINARIYANKMMSLVQLALDGMGVALVPESLVQNQLKQGELLRVLPDWEGLKFPISIVTPLGQNTSKRLRIVTSQIASTLKDYLAIKD